MCVWSVSNVSWLSFGRLSRPFAVQRDATYSPCHVMCSLWYARWTPTTFPIMPSTDIRTKYVCVVRINYHITNGPSSHIDGRRRYKTADKTCTVRAHVRHVCRTFSHVHVRTNKVHAVSSICKLWQSRPESGCVMFANEMSDVNLRCVILQNICDWISRDSELIHIEPLNM